MDKPCIYLCLIQLIPCRNGIIFRSMMMILIENWHFVFLEIFDPLLFVVRMAGAHCGTYLESLINVLNFAFFAGGYDVPKRSVGGALPISL